MSEPDGQVMHCSDCGGRSYGWTRCAICEVARVAAEPQPVEELPLFEEAS